VVVTQARDDVRVPVIDVDDPTAPDVRALLHAHLAHAQAVSPPEDVHALDADRLNDPSVSFFSARVDGELVGVGALREVDAAHVEIKSMHTAAAARGRGVGRAMLDHLISIARSRGYRRISLETGSMDGFAPARRLYQSAGFTRCEPFAGYRPSPYSVCMTLEIATLSGARD
jgi:putative acetyltransferase